jgi:transaldolase/glucose-6-phosphate isomerase
VASFFVSRFDSVVDQKLHAGLDETRDPERRSRLKGLIGSIAIANAKLAYARYGALSTGTRWKTLAERGARTQRLLWASTGTKNPLYPDPLYVDSLIGPDTVNTVPPVTLDAIRDHGRPVATLERDLAAAHDVLSRLQQAGIAMAEVTGQLKVQGVKAFADSFDQLINAIESKLVHA